METCLARPSHTRTKCEPARPTPAVSAASPAPQPPPASDHDGDDTVDTIGQPTPSPPARRRDLDDLEPNRGSEAERGRRRLPRRTISGMSTTPPSGSNAPLATPSRDAQPSMPATPRERRSSCPLRTRGRTRRCAGRPPKRPRARGANSRSARNRHSPCRTSSSQRSKSSNPWFARRIVTLFQ